MDIQYNNYTENISHYLNIIILNPPTKLIEQQIRQEIFFLIEKNPIIQRFNGIDVTICWKNISDNYYTDVEGIYGDVAVKIHTELLLQNILLNLNNTFDNIFLKGISIIAFRISKPLTRKICLI